jgi:hypothetical protein
MNATASDIYRELITLPENKLAEVWQFIELLKYDKQVIQQLKPQKPVKKLEDFAMPELFEGESIDDMLDYIYQQRQADKMADYDDTDTRINKIKTKACLNQDSQN